MTFLAKKQQAQFALKTTFYVDVAPLTTSGWTTVYRVDNAFSVPKLVVLAKFMQPTKVGPYTTDIIIRILASTDDVEYNVVDPTPVALPPAPDPTAPPPTSTTPVATLGISAAVQAELDKKAPLDANGKVPIANLPIDLNSGIVADKHYTHNQNIAATTWTVTHSMNKYPAVMVTDSTGEGVEGEVQYTGLNTLTIKFSAPFAGKAFFN